MPRIPFTQTWLAIVMHIFVTLSLILLTAYVWHLEP